MSSWLISIFKTWLPLAIAVTLICGIIYVVVQQGYRTSANDPQIQMAEDAANALENGITPEGLLGSSKIDMSRSLAPYLIIFDDGGNPLVSSVELDGIAPLPPAGVLDFTRKNKRDRITWQPRFGVRHAAVIVYFHGQQSGFVLAGRSLREVEVRERNLVIGVAFGWLFTLLATLITVVAMDWIFKESSRK